MQSSDFSKVELDISLFELLVSSIHKRSYMRQLHFAEVAPPVFRQFYHYGHRKSPELVLVFKLFIILILQANKKDCPGSPLIVVFDFAIVPAPSSPLPSSRRRLCLCHRLIAAFAIAIVSSPPPPPPLPSSLHHLRLCHRLFAAFAFAFAIVSSQPSPFCLRLCLCHRLFAAFAFAFAFAIVSSPFSSSPSPFTDAAQQTPHSDGGSSPWIVALGPGAVLPHGHGGNSRRAFRRRRQCTSRDFSLSARGVHSRNGFYHRASPDLSSDKSHLVRDPSDVMRSYSSLSNLRVAWPGSQRIYLI
ncbi:hypothetical protein OUZ56_015038 [Daphnia magna]|uniref:Uncharacterized protein n=1 Tax=Daphnia magna TaxID=35525 RepID=A0ABR0ALK7_9CRUS|nr:hypothetical protein OUZ56_015038 [Daphnia magna]